MTPLQRFRAYMARMNPVADPARAISEGLYVPPPGRSVAEQLAMRLELEPASTHLVLGGIGSGKTSELLQAKERLKARLFETGDHVEYIDVSQRHDLAAHKLSGVLVALAGLSLAAGAERHEKPNPKTSLSEAIETFRRYAQGYTTWAVDDSPDDDDDSPDYNDDDRPSDDENWIPRDVPGVLVSPEQPLPYDLVGFTPLIQTLRAAYPRNGMHAVFLFDSLDRLPSPERFREAVEHDLRVLKAAEIGVTVVGPTRFMAGYDRTLGDLFDHTHFQLAADPNKPDGFAFLKAVLRRRADADILPEDCLEPLARASGGVLRDLINLAKLAGNEAYAAGHDPINRDDVNRAIDSFGRNLAIGLDDVQVAMLKHLRDRGGFVIRGEDELSLLETRRVLAYGASRWVVHPALAPLLDAIPEAA